MRSCEDIRICDRWKTLGLDPQQQRFYHILQDIGLLTSIVSSADTIEDQLPTRADVLIDSATFVAVGISFLQSECFLYPSSQGPSSCCSPRKCTVLQGKGKNLTATSILFVQRRL